MSQQEFITGKCSQCGEELRIPAHLETFSCMYCGARLTPEDAALLDSYIEASKTTADTAARTEALLECNAILMDGAYVQPVYNASHLFCYNDTYTGITMDVGGTFYICDFDYAA